MAKQRRTLGSILKINLGDGNCSYAQILDKCLVFFDIKVASGLKKSELKTLHKLKELFFLSVYNDVISKGRWIKVGKLPIKDEYKIAPMKFIQDNITGSFELYNPNTGEITPSTYEDCRFLECSAVWEAEHVEERLRDHFNGMPNKWVKSLKPTKA